MFVFPFHRSFSVQVMDSSEFPLSDQTLITVVLEDVNDRPPLILEPDARIEIMENTGTGSEVTYYYSQ